MTSSILRFFVFRHGETDWNREKRFQGHTDIPLNSSGLAQAAELSEFLKNHVLDLMLSSDLQRARATAEVILRFQKSALTIDERLRECSLGEVEGLHREVIFEQFGTETMEKWFSVLPEDADFRFPGGESRREHLSRLQACLEEFALRHPHLQNVGVSTHGGSLRRLVHACDGAPTEPVAIPNCSLYVIQFDRLKKMWIFGERLK